MRAVLNSGVDGSPLLELVEQIDPGPNDVVIRVTASGVCHSDLSASQGLLGPLGTVVLGHEATGIIEAMGAQVQGLVTGDRVIASFRPACGRCWYCVRDQSHLCVSRVALTGDVDRVIRADGSTAKTFVGLGTFAEYMTANVASVVKVETDLPDEQLALIGCGVTTGVGAVLNTAEVKPGSTIAVIGCGGVGQSVIQGARIAGAAQIIAIDPVALKRDTALAFGATHAIDPLKNESVEAVRELTEGRGADYAFEVIGLPTTMVQAHAMIRPGGTAVLVGVPASGAEVTFNARTLQSGGRKIVGCTYGSAQVKRDFIDFISFAERGLLDLGAMVTRTISLSEVGEAFRALISGEVIRTVVLPAKVVDLGGSDT
jgi:S-(hydroxymethyl)glutathione dehydrogenase / alcohol dehydrogenase